MKLKLRSFIQELSSLSWAHKRLIQIGIDIILMAFCFATAMVLRLDDYYILLDIHVWTVFAIATPITVFVFGRLGLYRVVVRYITAQAITSILVGATIAALSMLIVSQALHAQIPRSVPFIFALLLLIFIGGIRFVMRAAFQWGQSYQKAPVIIYGAGASGRQLQLSLQFGREFAPVAFVDDSRTLQRREVGGLLVHNPDDLRHLVEAYGVEAVLLAVPSATRLERKTILARLESLPVRVQTIPGMADIVSGRSKTTRLREISVEDLLGRDPVKPMSGLMGRNITDKVVLVSGAGGSIGGELCRQIIEQKPRRLVLLDISEFALYSIEMELRAIVTARRLGVSVVPLLCSVCDGSRVLEVLQSFDVETIYHAAAYKHVPLVEENVVRGIENNLFGTQSIAEAAITAEVATFIMISTDKAVRPTNVMGATKRLAELVCQASAHRQSRTCFTMVRFGNVLGSSGSVIPLFKQQIATGGPITVTHPEITRYFMTIPEAAQLVIQAGAMARGGEVFVLDMGEPVRILDLAKRMARLSGYRAIVATPDASLEGSELTDGDIEIVFTRLRPGEKLYEELLIDKTTRPTDHPRISAASEVCLSWEELKPHLAALRRACAQGSVDDIRAILDGLGIGYVPDDEIADHIWLARERDVATQ